MPADLRKLFYQKLLTPHTIEEHKLVVDGELALLRAQEDSRLEELEAFYSSLVVEEVVETPVETTEEAPKKSKKSTPQS